MAGVAATAVIGGCNDAPVARTTSEAARLAEARRTATGGRLVTSRLVARPVRLDLGGPVVSTWGYADDLPGPVIRAAAGDRLRVDVDNQLPADTSVHWHGIALSNAMDGVPGMTQEPIEPGGRFRYEFTVPDPGTYFYHPHSGVQLDRGLYGVLIVDDPAEPGGYDAEWTVVLDDWLDGTGRTPDEVLAKLISSGAPGGMGGIGGMGGMDGMAGMGGRSTGAGGTPLGDAGDVVYPHYLVNGRVPAAPDTFAAKPGQVVRIRLINAGSDTAFRVALAGHRMTVTHTDGFPVERESTDALIVGMGERFDVRVTLGDGVFPLVALAEGKTGGGRALIRTGAGAVPGTAFRPAELGKRVLLGTDLSAAPSVRLSRARPDRTHDVVLGASMAGGYAWTLNGRQFPDMAALPVRAQERIRLRFTNQTMMFHPMHLHGHTFGVTEGGARKDTVIVRPMQRVEVDLLADNPGIWALHCHNIYHAETGMLTALTYRT